MDKKTIEKLIDTALAQLDFSYAPYSGFNVGAALFSKKSGSLHRLQYRNAPTHRQTVRKGQHFSRR